MFLVGLSVHYQILPDEFEEEGNKDLDYTGVGDIHNDVVGVWVGDMGRSTLHPF